MLFTYNPKDVAFSFGAIKVGGYSDGSMVKFTPDEDSFTKEVGADGQVTRVLNANASGFFTVTLKGSSQTNDLLTAVHALDRLSGTGVKPALLKDNSGTTVIAAAKSWIRKWPEVDKAKEVTDNEWIIDVDQAVVNVGGNTQD